MKTPKEDFLDTEGNINPRIHYEHHVWVHKKKTKEEQNEELTTKVKTSLVTALAIGTVFSLFGVLWWALVQFVRSGGQV